VRRTVDILAPPNRAVLESFARTRVMVALDYDGVLAPIAPAPEQARMRIRTKRLLARLAGRYPCEIVSGRPLGELARRLDGVPVFGLSANFGREPAAGRRPSPLVQTWVRILRESLARHEGLVVEDKEYSVTVHYRQAGHRANARRALRRIVRRLKGARAVEGVEAVALMPWPGPTKGTALQEARRRAGCTHAIYVGDDDTDEDAFASGGARRLLAIRVGASSRTRARFHLRSQACVDDLLETLLACTDQTPTPGPDQRRSIST
jgi:trehalose 6-phosphate phosphatase